jgi:hypothetical protein
MATQRRSAHSAIGRDEKLNSILPDQTREKELFIATPPLSPEYLDEDGERHYTAPAETAEDLVTEVIHVTDDPSLNPWTFRVLFLGKD